MMYKMKLQEVCQKRKWGLPKYTCMKCGPDHDPRFGASVSVNGTSFDSLVPCKSSKQAHNHVAMIAFLHFTSPSGSDTSEIRRVTEESHRNLEVQSSVSGPPKTLTKPDSVGDATVEEKHQSIETLSDPVADLIDDMKSQYESQLLSYAKQRNLDLPLYSSESDGVEASRFKATVRICERAFESLNWFNTPTEAENAAAKSALSSLLIDNFHKDGPGPYKSLLQELVHGEGLSMPVYRTTNSGLPHNPLFSSSVELEGEVFGGKMARTKKQAELEAAKLAYVALKERGNCVTCAPSGVSRVVVLEQDLKQSKENAEPDQPDIRSLAQLEESDTKACSGASSFLLCNKVRVYRKFPKQAFPEGIIVLPIGDNKWVTVSLEFQK